MGKKGFKDGEYLILGQHVFWRKRPQQDQSVIRAVIKLKGTAGSRFFEIGYFVLIGFQLNVNNVKHGLSSFIQNVSHFPKIFPEKAVGK